MTVRAARWRAGHGWSLERGTGHGYVGAVLHIDGVNRHVVYRIMGYVPRVRGYIAEWPD